MQHRSGELSYAMHHYNLLRNGNFFQAQVFILPTILVIFFVCPFSFLSLQNLEDFFLQNKAVLYTNDVLKGRNLNNPKCIINPGMLKVDVHQKEDIAITKLYTELSRKFE